MSDSGAHSKLFSGAGTLCLVVMVLASGFLVAVQSKIVTYTCGNDPMLYIRAARVFLSPSLYGPETLRHCLTFTAPGYSAILAVAIKCFGSLSPYWVNFVFLLMSLPLMWMVLRKLMGSDRAAAFALLGMLLIVFRGHELNAPFLLYPFREAARLFFVYLAYVFLLRGTAEDRVSIPGLMGSGVALLAAVSIREPSVLVLPGLILGAMLLKPTWKSRLKASGWIALPWLLGGVLGCLVLFGRNVADLSQFSVMQYLGNHHVAMANGGKMLGWFPGEATWPGMVLILAGVIRAFKRERALLALFLLPAVMFFIFYSYMQVHIRYFLTSLTFLAVFAGYGLDAVCLFVERLLSKHKWVRGVNPALTWAVVALLAMGLIHTAHTREVWGPKVKAADVREWQDLVKGLEPSADGRVRVVVEQRCRYLEGILYSYTDADLLDAKNMDSWPQDWSPAHYFKPLNRQAHYATPQWLMWLKIYAHRIMENRVDMIPVDPANDVHRIGRGEYSRYLVTKWTGGTHEQTVDLDAGSDNIIWLDWGACPDSLERTISVRNAEGGKEWISEVVSGSGLQAIRLPADVVEGPAAIIRVSADGALPSRPAIGVTSSQPMVFSAGVDRLMSLNGLFERMGQNSTEKNLLYLSVGESQKFIAPKLYGTADGHWHVTLFGRIEGMTSLYLRCSNNEGNSAVQDVLRDSSTASFFVRGGDSVDLSLESDEFPAHASMDIDGISFQYCSGCSMRGK